MDSLTVQGIITSLNGIALGNVLSLTVLLASLCITLSLVWLAQVHRQHQLFKKNGIPGPPPVPVFGNILEMARFQRKEELTPTSSWITKYGKVVGFYIGATPYMIVSDPNLISNILVSKFQYFNNRPDLYIDVLPMSASLVHDKGQRWKNRRTQLTPAFSSAKIKGMLPLMSEAVDTFLLNLEHSKIDQPIDVFERFQRLVLDIFVRSVIGIQENFQSDSFNKHPLLVSVRSFFTVLDTVLLVFPLAIRPLAKFLVYFFPFISSGKAAASTNDVLRNVLSSVKNNGGGNTSLWKHLYHTVPDPSKPTEVLPDINVVNDMYVLMLASYDTASKSLTYVCHLLAVNPDIQENVYQELLDLELNDDSVSLADLDSLKYMDQVLNEAHRIYPPFPNFITRRCNQDVTINGQFFPEGVNVEIPVWHLHHSPEYWNEPWKFDPSRFSVENQGKIISMSYLPFGTGPKKCLGMRLAMTEVKLTLVKLLLKYRLERSPQSKDRLSLRSDWGSILPNEPVYLKLSPRF